MAKRDFYEVLGVNRNADDAAIKRAYRTLAMKYHPDKNPGDKLAAEKMKELNEAYAILSNEEKRRLYDTHGHAGLEGFSQEDIFRGVDFGSMFGDLGGGGFGGIFEGLFGKGSHGTGQKRKRGSDLRYDLEVTLEEVATGGDRTIVLHKDEACAKCRGSGAAPGGLSTCEQCRGTGQVVTEKRSGYSIFRQISACSRCRGAGQIIKERCDQCQGKGVLEKKKEITVHVPRGADTGHAIKVEGEGEPGPSGLPAGDLYVVLTVKRHAMFERHGDDLYLQAQVGFARAALGGKVSVPGLEGDLELEILEGTQNGSVLRIGEKGMPRLSGRGRGDFYVVVNVVTPTNLSLKAKELLKQFAELEEAEAKAAPSEKKGKRVRADKGSGVDIAADK